MYVQEELEISSLNLVEKENLSCALLISVGENKHMWMRGKKYRER